MTIREWKPGFRYYEELIGIECERWDDVKNLIEALFSRDLRTCPHDVIVNTIIVPKEVVCFLPLTGIKHKAVELRHTMLLSNKVNKELSRRCADPKDDQSHYYTTGEGAHRTCCKDLVLVTTLQEIEAACM